MDIHLAGSRPTRRAPKEYFTGTVWQDPIIATASAGTRWSQTGWPSSRAREPPGIPIRSARRSTSSRASAGCRPRAARCVRSTAGRRGLDSAGEKHWHGGAPTTGMVHIAMQESLDGNHATWMEQVTDAEYSAAVG